MDYAGYWGLTGSPFHLNSTIVPSPLLEEAMARLSFLADEKRPLGIVVGEVGTGRSTLLHLFDKRLVRGGTMVVRTSLLGRQSYELLWKMGMQLGARISVGEATVALWRALESRFAELALDQRRIAILLDDVDAAVGDAVTQIGRLLVLFERYPKLATMVLVARPQHVERLGSRIVQQAHLRIDLDAWTLEETRHVVRQSLLLAGRSSPIFDDAAMERMHYMASGMPGAICRVADLALMVGAGHQCTSIGQDLIEGVYTEFAQEVAA